MTRGHGQVLVTPCLALWLCGQMRAEALSSTFAARAERGRGRTGTYQVKRVRHGVFWAVKAVWSARKVYGWRGPFWGQRASLGRQLVAFHARVATWVLRSPLFSVSHSDGACLTTGPQNRLRDGGHPKTMLFRQGNRRGSEIITPCFPACSGKPRVKGL